LFAYGCWANSIESPGLMVEVNWIELDGLPTFDREPRVDGGKYAKAHGASGGSFTPPVSGG
jgi:hypothetical protein